MNKKNLCSIARMVIGLISVILVVLGCGGGFKSDSPNSAQLEEPIFGSDSIR